MVSPTTNLTALVGLGAPILCLDTCSILDVMRDPTRDSVRASDTLAAIHLLERMEAGVGLVGLIAGQVRLEFDEHVDHIEEEAKQALKKLRDQLKRIDAVAMSFGATANTNLLHLDTHVTRARAVVDRLVAAATEAKQSNDVASRALNRLIQARTPASKGKQQMKDCVVVETYLEAVGLLRRAGVSSKIVFISSNTKDYAGETGSHLRQDLANEFAVLNIQFASNFGMAKHLLGL